jgi:Sugar phosphate isomerases/epimerases
MKSRRDFIKQASKLIAGGVVAPSLLSSCIVTHTHTHTHTHIYPGGSAAQAAGAVKSSKYAGLQLYSLRDMVNDEGIEKVLQAVAKMGYTNLETAAYNNGKFYGKEPAELKKMTEDLGMKLTSSHLSRNISNNRDEDMAWWNKATEAHSEAGMRYMVVPSAPFEGDGATADNVKRYCDYFNQIALVTAGASMQFGYHNHAFEFTGKVDGMTIYDYMLANTSPRHVIFQLDVYWIKKGGYDPVDYMKRYADRIRLLHIKDEKAIGVHNVVDFKAVFNQAYANGIKDWFVEVEAYDGTPQEDVKKSADYLINASFTK